MQILGAIAIEAHGLAFRTPGVAFRAAIVAEDLKKLVTTSPVTVEYRAGWRDETRWSDYNLPYPSVIVDAMSERDVAAVVCCLFNLREPVGVAR